MLERNLQNLRVFQESTNSPRGFAGFFLVEMLGKS